MAGADFRATTDTLSWAGGSSAPKAITVRIRNDTVPEGSEAFSVVLSGVAGAVLGTPA